MFLFGYYIGVKNYTSSPLVDKIAKTILEDTKEVISYSSATVTVRLNDDIVVKFWNSNKWYAYFSEGHIEKDGKIIFTWKEEMPSRRMLYQLKKHQNKIYKL